MNVLITGATGFLGKYIIEELINKDICIVALVRDTTKPPNTWDNVKIINGDINDDLTVLLKGVKIDCIIHNAAKTPGADFNTASKKELKNDFFNVNKKGTESMVLLGEKLKINHFIFVSSHGVLESYRKDFYVESKRHAETIVENSSLNWTIIRPSGIYGITNYWVEQILHYKKIRCVKIYGNGVNTQQYVYAKDVAIAIKKIMQLPVCYNKHYELAGSVKFTVNEYYSIVKKTLKTQFVLCHIPLFIPKIITFILCGIYPGLKTKMKNILIASTSLKYDNQRAIEDFNYSPSSFKEGFADMMKQINNHKKINY